MCIYQYAFTNLPRTRQANNILERHLVIADRVYTMADLKALGNETIVLPTIRDALAVRVKEDDKRKWNTVLYKYYAYIMYLCSVLYVDF